MLSKEQVTFYQENGFLRIPAVFTPAEVQSLADELDVLLDEWAITDPGWSGPWRQVYMDAETEKKCRLIYMHDLFLYSQAWLHACMKPELAEAVSQLLDGASVELHHTSLHIKPPESGHPFPMHQDNPFYEHSNGQYVDVLVHLDDTSHENGEIRFMPGSHKLGALPHVTQTPEGACAPHLPTDQYRIEDTVPVPAKAGDVVCFSIYTIHGSYINQTNRMRRLVRVGYRDPHNVQVGGQSLGRPGILVHGIRRRMAGQPLMNTGAAIVQV